MVYKKPNTQTKVIIDSHNDNSSTTPDKQRYESINYLFIAIAAEVIKMIVILNQS